MGAKARADVTPEIRGGLKRFFKIMEEQGKPVSTIWEELYKADPVQFMRLAISTMPKEQQIDLTQRTVTDFVLEKAKQRESDERSGVH